MPYNRPSWASSVRNKYAKLVPTLGGAEGYARASEDIGIRPEDIPVIRRGPANIADVLPGAGAQNAKVDFSRSTNNTYNNRNFNVTGAKPGLFGTLVSSGKVTLRNAGELLSKLDPSMVIGSVKGTVAETGESFKRLFGANALNISNFVTDATFRKMALGQKLTQEEMAAWSEMRGKELSDKYKKLGLDPTKQYGIGDAAGDVFNVVTAAASVIPVAKAGVAAFKAAPIVGRTLISSFTTKIGTEAVKDAVKAGGPLIIDTAGNVFAKPTSKVIVKTFLTEGLKDGFKFFNATAGTVAIEAYKQGVNIELMNEVRKIISPEAALRIERDQRAYVGSLSLGERLTLDLAVGIYLPFYVPGLRTTFNLVTNGKQAVETAMISRAFDKAFSDPKSIEILNKISEVTDLGTGLAGDVQLKGNLLKHLSTVMGEDQVAITTEHVLETMESWAKNPIAEVALKRAELEKTSTNLSWYSDKLGRALTPDERLMHWFITETQGKYIGDLGDNLAFEFEKALKLRTSGIAEGFEDVTKIVTRQEDIKLLAGDITRVGDVGSARSAIDGMLLNKTELLSTLRDKLRGLGGDLIERDGKFIIPEQFVKLPEIGDIKNALRDINEEILATISQAKALGISDNILKLPSNKWLLKEWDATTAFNSIRASSETAQFQRGLFQNFDLKNISQIKLWASKNAEALDRIFSGGGASPKLKAMFADAVIDFRNFNPDASENDVLQFLLSLPSKEEALGRVPKWVTSTLSKAEKLTLKMNEAVSNFDKQLLANIRAGADLPKQTVEDIVTETRRIEAQLPRGAFAPEYLSKTSRWGAGVTEIPLADEPLKVEGWAKLIADFSDSNGITRAVTDYLVPHNPTDIYVKAMNNLSNLIEKQAPGKTESVMRQISKIQDKGISLIPLMPGGGPKWEALGKPMVSGVDWKTLDKLGASFGVDNLGRMTREAFVNVLTESGVRMGIVDRLRAAPGIGAIYDALYRQWMLTRFALNPMFHAQQVPEAGIIGILRSFNLPEGMSKNYIHYATRNPLTSMTAEELELYKAVSSRGLGRGTRDALMDVDILKGTTLEENKRLAAFMAEFPVQVRGQLFDMPALKNVDPLVLEDYRDWILGLQQSPKAMADAINEAFSTTGFDLKSEAIKRAVQTTRVEVQKFTTYNLNRSALEKDLHAFLFPFSYQKKFWTEVGKFVGGGSVLRPVVVSEAFKGISDINDSPTMQEVRAKYPTMTGWIWNILPFNPTYPLIDITQGSYWLGGIRADPTQAVLWDTFVNSSGKYNLFEDPTAAAQKVGGGGFKFWTQDVATALNEVFKQETPSQQSKYIWMLNRLRQEAELQKH